MQRRQCRSICLGYKVTHSSLGWVGIDLKSPELRSIIICCMKNDCPLLSPYLMPSRACLLQASAHPSSSLTCSQQLEARCSHWQQLTKPPKDWAHQESRQHQEDLQGLQKTPPRSSKQTCRSPAQSSARFKALHNSSRHRARAVEINLQKQEKEELKQKYPQRGQRACRGLQGKDVSGASR